MKIIQAPRWLLGMMILAAFCMPASAQNQRYEIGIDFLGAFPKGDLEDNITDDGLGVGFSVAYRPLQSPFLVGFDTGFINYGSTSFKGPFRECCNDLEEVETKNNIATGHLFFKIQPRKRTVRPYFEGLVGVKHFFTTTTFKEDNEFDDTEREFDDTSLSYGIGAGLSFVLRDGRLNAGPTISLNFGARYLLGGETQYVIEESVEIDGTQVFFDVNESDTDMFIARIGFTVRP